MAGGKVAGVRIGTIKQFQWLRGIIASAYVLNALDGVFTIYWVVSGHATEANPAMDTLLRWGPVPFIATKLTLVFLGSVLLWRFRRNAWAVMAIFAVFLVYYAVLLYHLSALNVRILQQL